MNKKSTKSKKSKKKKRVVRTSKYTTKFANKEKKGRYASYLKEMRRVAAIFVDYLWNTHYEWKNKDGEIQIMDIQNEQYDIPPYFDYNLIEVETGLSKRSLSSLVTQCCGIVKANTQKQKKRLFILHEKQQNGEEINEKLLENIEKGVPVKPKTENINLEISSKCSDIQIVIGHFNMFLSLKSLGKEFGKINIPIKLHKQAKKWKKNSKMLTSFLLCNNHIQIRWEVEVEEKKEGKKVGGDTGKKTVLTLSDGQATPKTDKDNHSFDSIIEKLARKKKGSKKFRKAQRHREIFVNWTINQLNFSDIKELKLEKISNITFGRNVNRKMKHWANTLTVKKVTRLCEENGVRLSEQSSAYRSQRCSCCGIVLSRNRKKEEYFCGICGNEINADFNASNNHEIELPEIPLWLSSLQLNKTEGFYWKPEGFFDVNGKELRVPCSEKS